MSLKILKMYILSCEVEMVTPSWEGLTAFKSKWSIEVIDNI